MLASRLAIAPAQGTKPTEPTQEHSPTTEMADVLERLCVARSEVDCAIDYLETQVGR